MKSLSSNNPPARRETIARDRGPSLVSTRRKSRAKNASPVPATAGANALQAHEQAVIDAAMAILHNRLRQPLAYATNPHEAGKLAVLQLAGYDRECFLMLMLDSQHRLIASEEISLGSLMETKVYSREVVRCAMRYNAAAVIFAHNHPWGCAAPSKSDILLTKTLRRTLALVDVEVLDHFVVGGTEAMSFSELGLI